MKIVLSKEDLKRPHTDRSKYDLEHCHSCGVQFLRHNGVSKEAEEDDPIWCCSNRCLEWFNDCNPSYKDQKAIEKRLSPGADWEEKPWEERKKYWESLRVIADPKGTVGTNPYQSVIEATERVIYGT